MQEAHNQLGKVGYDADTGLYWGEVIFLCDTVLLRAESVDELRLLIHETVLKKQDEPEKARSTYTEQFSESLVICMDPALHLQLNQLAALSGESLNDFIVCALQEVTKQARISELV